MRPRARCISHHATRRHVYLFSTLICPAVPGCTARPARAQATCSSDEEVHPTRIEVRCTSPSARHTPRRLQRALVSTICSRWRDAGLAAQSRRRHLQRLQSRRRCSTTAVCHAILFTVPTELIRARANKHRIWMLRGSWRRRRCTASRASRSEWSNSQRFKAS